MFVIKYILHFHAVKHNVVMKYNITVITLVNMIWGTLNNESVSNINFFMLNSNMQSEFFSITHSFFFPCDQDKNWAIKSAV